METEKDKGSRPLRALMREKIPEILHPLDEITVAH